jgi:hypothetical protein
MITEPNPEALRKYAVIFEKMLPRSDATCAAAVALRWQADEIERRSTEVAERQTRLATGK